jgi:hypothetical protein
MANQVLSKANIANSNTIEAWQVSQSVDAFTGAVAYDITISGSLTVTGSQKILGSISSSNGANTVGFYGTSSWAEKSVTASYALTSSTPSSIVGQYTVVGNTTAIAGNLNIVAGYAVIPSGSTTVTLTISNLTGKTLGVDCFVSLAISSSFNSIDLNNFPRVNSLTTSQLQFGIPTPHSSNIQFTYTIIYV